MTIEEYLKEGFLVPPPPPKYRYEGAKTKNVNSYLENPIKDEIKFKIGDRVKIIPGTKYYLEDTSYNPANVEGVVFKAIPPFYTVLWDNGQKNAYSIEDLEIVNKYIEDDGEYDEDI